MKTKVMKKRFAAIAVCLMLIIQSIPTQEIFAVKEQPKVSAEFSSVMDYENEIIEIIVSANDDNVEVTGIKLPDGSFVESDKATYSAQEKEEYKFEVFYREAYEVNESVILDEIEVFEENQVNESVISDEIEYFEENEVNESVISDEIEYFEMEKNEDVENKDASLFQDALAYTNKTEDNELVAYEEGSEVFSFKSDMNKMSRGTTMFDYEVNINDPLLAEVNIYINDVKQTSLEGEVPLGAKIRIEVMTIRGYWFVGWGQDQGVDYEIDTDEKTFIIWQKDNVTSSVHVQALIAMAFYEIISQAEAGGQISPEGTEQVDFDDSKTYSIEPYAGYYIEDVIVDDESKGAVDTYTFENVDMDHKIVAKFSNVRLSKDIVSSAGVGGEISPIGITNVFVGETKEYTITPFAGYMISDVVVDNVSIGPVTSYAFENVRDNHTIEAVFTKESTSGGGSVSNHTLKYQTNGGNDIESKTVLENTVVQLNKIPVREGFTFEGWFLDSELTMKITEVVMNENKTVYAKWKENKVDIPVVPPVEPPVVKPVRPSIVKPVGPIVDPAITQPVVPPINESINSPVNPLINATIETTVNPSLGSEVNQTISGNVDNITATTKKDAEENIKIVITPENENMTIENTVGSDMLLNEDESSDDEKSLSRPAFGFKSSDDCGLHVILWALSIIVGIIIMMKRRKNNKKIEAMMKEVN